MAWIGQTLPTETANDPVIGPSEWVVGESLGPGPGPTPMDPVIAEDDTVYRNLASAAEYAHGRVLVRRLEPDEAAALERYIQSGGGLPAKIPVPPAPRARGWPLLVALSVGGLYFAYRVGTDKR